MRVWWKITQRAAGRRSRGDLGQLFTDNEGHNYNNLIDPNALCSRTTLRFLYTYACAAQLNSCLHAQRQMHWEVALSALADGMCANGKCNLIAPRVSEREREMQSHLRRMHAAAAATERPALWRHTQACKTSAWPRNHLPCTWNLTAFVAGEFDWNSSGSDANLAQKLTPFYKCILKAFLIFAPIPILVPTGTADVN